MAGDAQQKQPTEIIQMGADFTQSLLAGESIVSGNISIVVTNAYTDVVSTGTILVGGSTALSTNTITGRFTGGADGDVYTVVFDTGSTNLGNRYRASINLVVTQSPTGDNLFCNLAEVKRLLSITDTSVDQLLGDLIVASTGYLSKRIGRDVFLKKYTERVYLTDDTEFEDENFGCHGMVFVRNFPVRQVDSIALMSASDQSLSATITPSSLVPNSYDFTADGRVFFRHTYSFMEAPDYNVITYRAGYDAVPDDLREAAKRIVAILYRWRGREGLSSERIGDYSWAARQLSQGNAGSRAELDDPFVEGVIRRYRRADVVL